MRELRVRRARTAALQLLKRFGLEREYPVPVEDIAWALGVEVVHGGLTGALASLTRAGDRARIRVSDEPAEPGQLRFSIAHELGHLVLKHPSSLDFCEEKTIQRYFLDGDTEAEANAFAAELLMPQPLVQRRCDVSPVDLDVIGGIAADFGTSLVATAIRFAELTAERCAVVFAQQRRVRWVVRSSSFWPRIERGQALSPWSLADDYFARGSVSRACEPIDASAWVPGNHLEREEEIFEHATTLPSLGAVLSLVWIPESAASLAHRVA